MPDHHLTPRRPSVPPGLTGAPRQPTTGHGVGVTFPHHQAAADELVRVRRPGGTLGLISWTPPYAALPPEGAQPPPLRGREDHVTELLGEKVTDRSPRSRPCGSRPSTTPRCSGTSSRRPTAPRSRSTAHWVSSPRSRHSMRRSPTWRAGTATAPAPWTGSTCSSPPPPGARTGPRSALVAALSRARRPARR